MPELSRFFGIVIRIYFDDHAPPHFHARYAEYEGLIEIEQPRQLRGNLPARVLSLVIEWAELHKAELRNAWNSVSAGKEPSEIPPLV